MKKRSNSIFLWSFIIIWFATSLVPIINDDKLGWIQVMWAYGGLIVILFERGLRSLLPICSLVIIGHISISVLLAFVTTSIIKKRKGN